MLSTLTTFGFVSVRDFSRTDGNRVGLYRMRKKLLHQGHGFSRAEKVPQGRLSCSPGRQSWARKQYA